MTSEYWHYFKNSDVINVCLNTKMIGEWFIFDLKKIQFAMSNGYETAKLVHEIIDGPS